GGDLLGAGPDQIQRHPLGQCRLHRRGDLLDLALDADRVALVRAVDPDGHRRVVANVEGFVAIDAADPHRRHVADGQGRAVRVRAQRNTFDILLRAFGDAGTDARIGARDIAGRTGLRFGGDGAGDLC